MGTSQRSTVFTIATGSIAAATALYLIRNSKEKRTRRAKYACDCGKVEVEIHQPAANYRYIDNLRLQCACTDCVSFAERVLDSGSADKPHFFSPGTDTVVLYKSEIKVTKGGSNLQSMKLSEKTENRRVYSTCCGTPMAISVDGSPLNFVYTDNFIRDGPAAAKLESGEVPFPDSSPEVCFHYHEADPKRRVQPESMKLIPSGFAPRFIAKIFCRLALLSVLGTRGPGEGFPVNGKVDVGIDTIDIGESI